MTLESLFNARFIIREEGWRGWWRHLGLACLLVGHRWTRGTEWEDTGYSAVPVCYWRECERCELWQREDDGRDAP